jgi:16S rRNA C1402 N4-methylase RsmH
VRLVTKKALRPTPQEIEQNPMARSTRLRCAEKLET